MVILALEDDDYPWLIWTNQKLLNQIKPIIESIFQLKFKYGEFQIIFFANFYHISRPH